MSEAAELRILLSLRDEASAQLKNFRSSLGTLNNALGGLLPALSVAAVVAGFDKMMVSAAAYGEEVGLAAEKTGLSVNLLQGLKFAADTSGASMDSLTIGVKKMSTVLAEAFSGNKAAMQSIEELGLSVEDLLKMNPDQRIMAIFTAISKIEDPTLKSAAAVKLLGRSGTDLIPLIDDVDQLVSKFNKLHIALSQADIQSLRDGKTAMEEMKISWELLSAKFSATQWPNFKPLLDGLAAILNITIQLQQVFNGLDPALKMLLFPQSPVTLIGKASSMEIHFRQPGEVGQDPRAILKALGLPSFAGGGIVPGPTGAPVPIMAHGGETVGGGGGGTINIRITSVLDGQVVADTIEKVMYNRTRYQYAGIGT